jgi:hypothetical protein
MFEHIGVQYRVNPSSLDEPADFVLFFQSYPHEFVDLSLIRQCNPFVSFFFVLGTCCEGMLRTAGPLEFPFYCYAHGWSDKEIEQIRLFLTDQYSLFSLPPTAEGDEIAQWLNPVSPSPLPAEVGTTEKKCLILTHFGPFGNDSAMNQLIADKQRRLGFEPQFLLPPAACRLLPILADADNSPREKILETIQRIRQQFADNEFTVYVDSPRIDEKSDYIKAGVTRVLAKMR